MEEKNQGEQQVQLQPWQQHLLLAADYMQKHGHCKHEVENELGQVCLIGALHKTTLRRTMPELAKLAEHKQVHQQVHQAINQFLSKKYPGYQVGSYIDWNNKPDTTGEQVIECLREAAKEQI